jgi:hypothetical protein
MANIFRNGIHRMCDDNASSVTSLAAPVRINQYVFGNMCDKARGRKVLLAQFFYSTRKHIGMGIAIRRKQRDWMRIANFVNWQVPAMKINFTSLCMFLVIIPIQRHCCKALCHSHRFECSDRIRATA